MKTIPSIHRILLVCCMVVVLPAKATHVAGGEMSYKLIANVSGLKQYQVSLVIYQDCQGGAPEAIVSDIPAYLGLYRGTAPYDFVSADSAHFISSEVVSNLSNSPCGYSGATSGCTLKKTFQLRFNLDSRYSYTVAYQRCCRGAVLTNIFDPVDVGSTLYCTIPAAQNNSAVFNKPSIQYIQIGRPFELDLSATDADGDSLSYEFCSALQGGSTTDLKPWPPAPPPYTNVSYANAFTYDNPIKCTTPAILDPVTGKITGTAIQLGSYLVAVTCHEWRAGVLINTVRKEIQIRTETIATTDYKPNAGTDVFLTLGETYEFRASGAKEYTWSPATYLDDPNIANPKGRFTDAGFFTYVVHGVSDSGCTGDDTVTVNVIAESSFAVPNAFSPNGDGINDYLIPFPVGNSELFDFRIFNRLGNKVFQASDPQNAAWDGKYRGKQQDMGVYVWQLQFVNNNKQNRLIKGNVTLIR